MFPNNSLLVFLSGFSTGWSVLQLLAALCVALGMGVYAIFTYAFQPKGRAWLVGAFLWPIVIFQELIFFINSVQGYYRHTITWKGRPVTPATTPLSADS